MSSFFVLSSYATTANTNASASVYENNINLEIGERKEISIPSEYRKTKSKDNQISWSIDDDTNIKFVEYNDFDAEIICVGFGKVATITCKQGNTTIATIKASGVITYGSTPEYNLKVGKNYLITVDDVKETDKTELEEANDIDILIRPSISISSTDYVSVLDRHTDSIIVKANKVGKFSISEEKFTLGSKNSRVIQDDNGGVSYEAYNINWNETIANCNVIASTYSGTSSVVKKETTKIEVPTDNRGTVSTSNQIEWETSNKKVVDFLNYKNFEAEIIGIDSGSATVSCLQGGDEIAKWDVTVTLPKYDIKTYEILLDNNYLISSNGAELTEDSTISGKVNYGAGLKLSSESYAEILDQSSEKLLIKTIKIGEFELIKNSISIGGSAPSTKRIMGGIEYNNSINNFSWSEPVAKFKVIANGKQEKSEDDIEIARKQTKILEVPKASRLEMSTENQISWKTENENIISFTEYEDFKATVRAEQEGKTTVKCLQGNKEVAVWNFFVTKSIEEPKNVKLEIGKKYYIDKDGAKTTNDTKITKPETLVGKSYKLSSGDALTLIEGDSNGLLVEAKKLGKISLIYHNGLAGSGGVSRLKPMGGVYFHSGGNFNWDDVVLNIEVCSKVKVTFETNGGSSVDAIYVLTGETIEDEVSNTKKEGYTFLGWFKDKDLKKEFDVEKDVITEDTTLYAGWNLKAKTYTITTKATNGKVTPSKATVTISNDKKFTFTPNTGYIISDVLIDGSSVGAVSDYTFKSVNKDHTIEVLFKYKGSSSSSSSSSSGSNSSSSYVDVGKNAFGKFNDIPSDSWFYESVKYCVDKEIFKGVSEDRFGPNDKVTRGMLVTILYRIAKEEEDETSTFEDVDSSMYYSIPISWAYKNGLVSGVGDNRFAPDKEITRQDLATIISKFIQNYRTEIEDQDEEVSYSDESLIAPYAIDNVRNLQRKGIMKGKDVGFDPRGNSTRAEIAAIVMRLGE